jgi:hypothetical protein
MRASLDAYATDNILVIDARLVLQKEIALEQRKVRGVGGGGTESFTQMHKVDDLEDKVRVEMN